MATVTTSTTLTATDTVTVVNATDVTAAIVITLSAATSGSRHLISRIDNISTVSVTVVTQSGNSVNGVVSLSLPVGSQMEFISDKVSTWTSLNYVQTQTLQSAINAQNDVLNAILNQLQAMS